MMHDHEKSDLAIVAEKLANKAGMPAAEGTASEAQSLPRRRLGSMFWQIGRLKVENDFLARSPRT